MSSPNSIEEEPNHPIRPPKPLTRTNSASNHHYDTDFVMDNESNDFKELRQSIITNRRLSEATSNPTNPVALSSSASHGHNNTHNNHSAPVQLQPVEIQKNSLLRMPTEVLLQIFHNLDRKDLFSLLTVCKEFSDLIIEILWFRPNMQNDLSFKKIKEVMEIPRHQTYWDYRQYIKRLNLSFMTKLVDDDLLSLFIGCPKLERLTLVNCTKLTRKPITQVLQNCEKLQSIDLTGVSDIHDSIIDALAQNCLRLQGLYAPGCGNVCEASIIKLLDSCPMLKRVKFNNSENITDECILAMYENCKSLVEIDLHNCPNVSDKYLKNIFADLSQLREFRISNAAGITDKLFELLPNSYYLEKLRIIDITGCNAITDKLVEKLVICAPRLRNVVLSKCMQITDASLRALSSLGRSLHYIHLGHCGLITDFGVASLVRSCHRIQYIDLACCTQLTDWTLIELSNLPKLRRIGLVKCSLISDNGILELVRRRGEQDCLERVHLSYCTNLSIGPIYLLLKSCPKLTHLSLTGISSFLRREITQYCRDPPPDFNEAQKSSFCVFSGHGVNQLRNYLFQIMEERAYSIEQGDIHDFFFDRRRRANNNGNNNNNNNNNNDNNANNNNNNNNNANNNNNNNNANNNNNNEEGDDIYLNDNVRRIWERRAEGLGLEDNGNQPLFNIDREIFRELNEGNMTPEEMREHFQRLIRNHHQQRILAFQQAQQQQAQQQAQQQRQQQVVVQRGGAGGAQQRQDGDNLFGQPLVPPPAPQQGNIRPIRLNQEDLMPEFIPQNAPQIEQQAVFPNDDQIIPDINDDDEDVEMEAVGLFPRN